jgi:23S rRNA (adenine-N6)-dimethyltransferase
VDAPRGSPRVRGFRPSGQHFLRSDTLAEEIVDRARVTDDQYVLDIGAGTGRITRALARRAGRVMAVEVDPELVRRLRRDFRADPRVEVIEADFLEVRLPQRPFRAFGNMPFGIGTSILRRLLDDPGSSLTRADLILQYEVARKRASAWPGTAATIGWLPWWEFTLVRRFSRLAFDPPPAVDAGLLSITRRDPALVAARQRDAFVRLVRTCFARGSQPLRRSLSPFLSDRTWKRLARERGLSPSTVARDLDVVDWVAIFRLLHA